MRSRVPAYSPIAPTHIARAFTEAEMPEERVRSLILALLQSPMVAEAAMEIETRLRRPLEPQDLWYEFGGGSVPEAELDKITRKKYPTSAKFAADDNEGDLTWLHVCKAHLVILKNAQAPDAGWGKEAA